MSNRFSSVVEAEAEVTDEEVLADDELDNEADEAEVSEESDDNAPEPTTEAKVDHRAAAQAAWDNAVSTVRGGDSAEVPVLVAAFSAVNQPGQMIDKCLNATQAALADEIDDEAVFGTITFRLTKLVSAVKSALPSRAGGTTPVDPAAAARDKVRLIRRVVFQLDAIRDNLAFQVAEALQVAGPMDDEDMVAVDSLTKGLRAALDAIQGAGSSTTGKSASGPSAFVPGTSWVRAGGKFQGATLVIDENGVFTVRHPDGSLAEARDNNGAVVPVTSPSAAAELVNGGKSINGRLFWSRQSA